jgi:hypothetical protein
MLHRIHAVLLWHGDVKVASQCISLKTGENSMFTRESLSAARCHSDLFKPIDDEEAEGLAVRETDRIRGGRVTQHYTAALLERLIPVFVVLLNEDRLLKRGRRKISPTKLSKLEQNCPRPSCYTDSTFLGVYYWPAISLILTIDILEVLSGITAITKNHFTSR